MSDVRDPQISKYHARVGVKGHGYIRADLPDFESDEEFLKSVAESFRAKGARVECVGDLCRIITSEPIAAQKALPDTMSQLRIESDNVVDGLDPDDAI